MTTPAAKFIIIRDDTPAAAIPRGAVVAMGNFDGVHLGHRAVIDAAQAMAKALGAPALAVTFEPHPRKYFSPRTPQFRLTDEAAKLRLLAGTGLAGAVVMTFDKAPRRHPGAGLHRTRSDRPARHQRHRGRLRFPFRQRPCRLAEPAAWPKRRGSASRSWCSRMSISTSGRCRRARSAWRWPKAKSPTPPTMLGGPWFVSGEVIHGEKRGRDLGYPTANIRLDPDCGLKHGIYAVRVGDRRPAS